MNFNKIALSVLFIAGYVFFSSGLSAQRMYDNNTKLPPETVTISSNIVIGGNNHIDVLSLPSKARGGRHVAVTVCLPPGYFNDTTTRYPVQYYCHGQGGSAKVFSGDPGEKCAEAHALMQSGAVKPFIWVASSGGPFQWVGPSEEFFVRELIPYIDSAYRTLKYPEQRSILGFSMGGAVALRLGIKYKDLFSSVVCFRTATFADTVGNYDLMTLEYPRTCPPFAADPLPILAANGTQDLWEKRWSPQWLFDKYGIGFDTLPVLGCDHNPDCYFSTEGDSILSFTEKNYSPIVSEYSGKVLIASEDGTAGTFSLRLLSAPTTPVTVRYGAGINGFSFSPDSVVFTPSTWNTPRSVSVSAQDNAQSDPDYTQVLRFSTESADPGFDGKRPRSITLLKHDDESPTTVQYARQEQSQNPLYRYHSSAYMMRENAGVDQFPPAYNDIQNYPKQRELVLTVSLRNPAPGQNYKIKTFLTENKRNPAGLLTPGYCDSSDLGGWTDAELTFAPGDTLAETVVPITDDNLTEGTEFAQFTLGCPTGIMAYGYPYTANIGISDDESDGQTQSNIIISEITTGPHGTAVELFNANYRDLNVNVYKLKVIDQSGGVSESQSLIARAAGSFRAGEALVYCGANASPELKAVAAYVIPALDNFDGDDVLELVKSGSVVDRIGSSSQNPGGAGWTVAGTPDATAKTMIRKPSVKAGNTNFATQIGSTASASEWVIDSSEYHGNLGVHAYLNGSLTTTPDNTPDDPCGVLAVNERPKSFARQNSVSIFPNPTEGIINIQSQKTLERVALYDLSGALIETVIPRHTSFSFSLKGRPAGLYLIRYYDGERWGARKVVKR